MEYVFTELDEKFEVILQKRVRSSVPSGFPNTRKQMKQSKLKLRSSKLKIKSLKSKLIKIRFPNHRHGYDFFCYSLLN